MSVVEGIDKRVEELVLTLWESDTLRMFFTDIYPYMGKATRKFGLEEMWLRAYEKALGGDFEKDRVILFLGWLLEEDRGQFQDFMEYAIGEAHKFHPEKGEYDEFFDRLEALFGFRWDGEGLRDLGEPERLED